MVAAYVLWYHWYLVLHADVGVLRRVALERRGVAVISDLDTDDTERLKEFGRTALDGARIRIYWTDQAHAEQALRAARGGVDQT